MSDDLTIPGDPKRGRLVPLVGYVVACGLFIVGGVATWGWWSGPSRFATTPLAHLAGPLLIAGGVLTAALTYSRGRWLVPIIVGGARLFVFGWALLGTLAVLGRLNFLIAYRFFGAPAWSKMGPSLESVPSTIAIGLFLTVCGLGFAFLLQPWERDSGVSWLRQKSTGTARLYASGLMLLGALRIVGEVWTLLSAHAEGTPAFTSFGPSVESFVVSIAFGLVVIACGLGLRFALRPRTSDRNG